MTSSTSADLETGRGSWDEGQEKWEGEVPAEPKRQRLATGERQMAIGDWLGQRRNADILLNDRRP